MDGKPYYDAADFAAKRSIGYLIRRASRLAVPLSEGVFDDAELSLAQWIALKTIHDGLGDTSAVIARNLCHDSGATTRLIDQLEQRGLLARERDRNDRRRVILVLTEEGRAAVMRMTPALVRLWNELLEDFTHQEIDMMIDLLGRLVEKLEIRSETKAL